LRGWRLWLGLLLLLIVAGITSRAGFWQLSRADEKRAVLEQIEAADAQGALALSPAVDPEALTEWRQVWARGYWQPDSTVLVQNRNHDGRPGYWVVTPLCLESPDAPEPIMHEGVAVSCNRAVAVLRGWLPRPLANGTQPSPGAASSVVGYDAVPSIPTPPPYETIEGRLLSHVPRLFELGSLTGAEPDALAYNGGAPAVQNLHLDQYEAAIGLNLLPVVLQQTGGGDELVRDWAGPAVDVEKNLGYALQWFSFAAIALIAFGVILVKAFRFRKR